LSVNVNKVLREEVEKNEEFNVPRSNKEYFDGEDTNINYFDDEHFNIIASLAKNETKANNLLDKMWEQFGNFHEQKPYVKRNKIMKELKKEVTTFENKCLEDEACWLTVEKVLRSLAALFKTANQPEYFGNYLGYHATTLFKPESYIQPNYNPKSNIWPWRPFEESKPDKQELALNEYFMKMTLALSGGKMQNVSLLDLPAFGSTLDFFETENCNLPWSLQLNMAIYDIMISNNSTWSKHQITEHVTSECKALINQWRKYMNDTEANDFPPEIQKNTLFNFTNYIKEDMSTFLLAYSASFPNLLRNETIWRDIVKVSSIEANSEDEVRNNGTYDKLVVDCSFQEPLMSRKPDAFEGCTNMLPVLTDNGLCYSFNGIETSKVWNQTLRDSEILQSFSTVFGNTEELTRRFRGIGHSEGKHHI
jgi:hypothetical protein